MIVTKRGKTLPPIARRNLFHDKVRLAVTLTGITFAVVLMVVELGLFIGFSRTTTGLIDHSGADLWVTSRHIPYIEQGAIFSERKLYQVRATPGVQSAEKYICRFGTWKRPDGGLESVQVVGFNVNQAMGTTWNIVQGQIADLKIPAGAFVDDLYAKKLGVTHLGQVLEINGHRVRIVGMTHDIRSFTTSPYIFMTFRNALEVSNLTDADTVFLMVKAAPGVDPEMLRATLQARLRDVDVLTTGRFSLMTRSYWMFTTGAGIAVLLAAVLGLVVGIVVVTQTIYATTIDHLREYGTLKAMGAPNSYIYRVILEQAAIAATIGYVMGMTVSLVILKSGQSGGAALVLTPGSALLIFFLTASMCVIAAMVSIQKILTIDPAVVFKN
jgi:putative ABC transport system permease protein